MKKIRGAHIVAIMFGIVILIGMTGFLSVNSFLKPIYANILSWSGEKSVAQNISSIEKEIENVINENVGLRTGFIQANGLAQKLMGKRVVTDVDPNSGVIRLDNGYLTFVDSKASDKSLQNKADNMLELKNYLNSKGADFLYVQAPTKVDKNNQQLPVGISDYSTDNCERFCQMLGVNGVDTLNLIEKLREEGTDWYSMFFKTDHHWTNEAGFWAYTELAALLEESYGMSIDDSHTNIESYTKKVYENIFLGSLGKRTGSTYSGFDNISVFTPNFETSFEYSLPINNVHRSGSFEEALLFEKEKITGDYWSDFPYSVSLGGDFGYMKITNNLNPDGKKIMIVKDSYADPVSTFLALDVAELEVIDLRMLATENNKTLKDCIDESNPDMVIVLYSSQQFFKTSTFDFGL